MANFTQALGGCLLSAALICLSVASDSVAASVAASTQQDDLVMAGDNVNNVFEQGAMKKTNRAWDLAITGAGFFPLQDAKTGETLYTRLGHFELNRDGYVVLSGHPTLRLIVMTESQIAPLNLPKWSRRNGALMAGLAYDKDSDDLAAFDAIYTNGEVEKVATLLLAKLFNNGKLTAVIPHIYKAEANALPSFLAPPTEKGLGRIESGALEQL